MICELEIEFGGDVPKDPPADEVDSILKKQNKILDFGFTKIKNATGKKQQKNICRVCILWDRPNPNILCLFDFEAKVL